MLPNFQPLASCKCPGVSEVGVPEAAADRSEGICGIYRFVSSCFLAGLYAHCSNYFTRKNTFLHVPFSSAGQYLPLQLSMTVLTCSELPSFPSEVAASGFVHSFIY